MPLISQNGPLHSLCTEPAGVTAGPLRQPPELPPEIRLALASAHDALADRRSRRQFTAQKVPAGALRSACDLAVAADGRYWPGEACGDPGLGIVLAAAAVDGLEPGFYRYSPELGFTWRGAAAGHLRLLHAAYAKAPVLLLLHGELDQARSAQPAHGYQRLLVRAGAIGYTALLSLLGAGLAGCPFGAADDTAARVLREAVPVGRPCHLFTVAAGWAAGPGLAGSP
jgi:hypothetical protein